LPKKINLGVGAYRTDKGQPFVLPSVKEAENRLMSRNLDHEYAPISGLPTFIDASLRFAFGENAAVITDKRVAATQAISGTGALRLAAEFVKRYCDGKPVYLPNPTWGNHAAIFTAAGMKSTSYPYYDAKLNTVDFEKLKSFLETAQPGVVLLHACAQNPTGCDLTAEQWRVLSTVLKKTQHVLLFDCAYQGFASGDAEADAFAIRHFIEEGHSFLLCQSFAKNFGLYGERAGLLSVVTTGAEETERINSQLKTIVRAMYSNPPIHGARIVAEVLSDPQLKAQWAKECQQMAQRIKDMRQLLRSKLEAGTPKKQWNHVTDQIGMFCYTGLTKEQVLRLREEYHIYCTDDGRFSLAGINSQNIDYLAASILAVL